MAVITASQILPYSHIYITHPSIHPSINPLINPLTHSLAHPPIHLFNQPPSLPYIHSFIIIFTSLSVHYCL